MRRIARAAGVLAFVLMAGASDAMRADDPPRPDPGAVDRVLAEWRAKVSAITSVDVRFRMRDEAKSWDSTRRVGRAVLATPNRAFLETYTVGPDGKTGGLFERMIWDGRTILQFDPDEHRVFRFPLRAEWPAAPGPLRLPFFFRMTVEEAKRDYGWSVVRETENQVLLKASPMARPGPLRDTGDYFLFLDRKTFLPKTMIVQQADGGRQTYEVVEIRLNPTEPLDDLFEPCLDAWIVEERDDWLTRLFLK